MRLRPYHPERPPLTGVSYESAAGRVDRLGDRWRFRVERSAGFLNDGEYDAFEFTNKSDADAVVLADIFAQEPDGNPRRSEGLRRIVVAQRSTKIVRLGAPKPLQSGQRFWIPEIPEHDEALRIGVDFRITAWAGDMPTRVVDCVPSFMWQIG